MVRCLGLGDDHQPAGVLVEAMHDPWAADPTDTGQARTTMTEQRIDERAVGITGRGMDNHAGRLVDDNEVRILEADIECDRLGYRQGIVSLGDNYDEILILSHAQRGIAQYYPVLRHISVLDQAFEPRP